MTTRSRRQRAKGLLPDRPRVLVTDAGRGSAISVIRSLGRAGWDVTAADDDRASPGFYSRYASRCLRYPTPMQDPDRFASALLDDVERLRIDLVVPVTDDVILPLSTIRGRLEEMTAVALPSAEALELGADKVATARLARDLGIPTPKSFVVDDPTRFFGSPSEFGWPLVVKPARSRTRRDDGTIARHTVAYAADPSQLAMLLTRSTGPVLVQEYVVGEGHGVELLMEDGVPVAAFQHRRLREVPVTGGASAFRVSEPLDPELFQYATALLAAARWSGLAMVEFRVGAAGPRLMEINGRIWGSLPLAVRSGVDFPTMMADFHMGRPVNAPPLGEYRIGVTSRSLPLELAWIGGVLTGRRPYAFLPTPSRREAIRAALRLVANDGWDVQSRSDPMPGLIEIARLAARTLARSVHGGDREAGA